EVRRAVDAVVLTTDANWTPRERGFPPLAYSQYLVDWGKTRKPLPPLVPVDGVKPHAWPLPKIGPRDFWYTGVSEFIQGFPKPVHIRNKPEAVAYAAVNGSNPSKAPIYSSPVCAVAMSIAKVKELLDPSNSMRQYILSQKIPFVVIGNYGSAG